MELHYTVNTHSVRKNFLLLVRIQHIFGMPVTVQKEKTFIRREAKNTLYRTN